jgi:hypothetical protein
MALTAERVRELFDYQPNTGLLVWRRKQGRKAAGMTAGCANPLGYLLVGVDGGLFQATHIIWLLVTGALPKERIDHRNGKPGDNRWDNLREATPGQNMANTKRPSHNTSGFKGVHFHRQTGLWRARISKAGKFYSLGLHDTPEAAHAAYRKAANDLHGEFANYG